jgi:hypothetical protein
MTWILTIVGPAFVLALPLAVPIVRETLAKYIGGFVQLHFDERIEKLKSELRQNEERLAADLRSNEQQLRSLMEVTLSLRSSRQAALDARRLQAVEKLWSAKVATDRMIVAAKLVSGLNLDEMFKAAEKGDGQVSQFAALLDQMTGIDFKAELPSAAATSEQPFLPTKVWLIFSAYQRVIMTSALYLKAFAVGGAKYINKDDTLKPAMLLALPEHKEYIEKYGFSGYYNLLETLDQKLLQALNEMLEGRDLDDATLKRSAEIISAIRGLRPEQELEIPESLKGPEIPAPPKP